MQPIDRSQPPLEGPSVMETLHARKEAQPNVAPLGAVSAAKVERLFGQAAPQKLPPKVDPAPSRAKYKMQRLWLTPMVRGLVCTGVPMVAILGVALLALSNDELRNRVATSLADARENIQTRPEFQIELMKISGASEDLAQDIRNALGLKFPISSFQVNLELLQDKIEQLDGVYRAELYSHSSNLLEVKITERIPVIMLRKGRELDLLDADGVRTGIITSRLDRRDLPLIAGLEAEENIPEALALFDAAKPILPRVRGLRRMGARRWDVMMDKGQIIQLPEQNAVAALERVIALHGAQKILNRDVRLVDMRNSERPILRLSDVATELFRASAIPE
ncbi:cell division protein FtsQ [Amylibacter marinus]|uniref:Cell division protein FtsQ n=1 Tax=Amylibacter marinus TaxID=1475483 RepID=A0ABQ5VUD4_9RHOB|nr:cell division protein FtsQ/DivIB [Amylibacter marinus]GLQ34867.1 cell division protein FtsQ [Amylibacter marinus]